MTMLQDCKINMNATVYDTSDTFNYLGVVVNSLDPGDTVYSIATGDNGGVVAINEDMRPGSAGDMHCSVFFSGHVKKGDVIRVQTYQDPTGGGASRIWVDAQPIPSKSIVLESQDEIFTDWTAFTPTGTWTTNTTYKGFWKRNGSMMDLCIEVDTSGAPNSSTLAVNLPSGYVMDTSKLMFFSAAGESEYNLGEAWMQDGGGGNVDVAGRVGFETTTSIAIAALYSDSGFSYVKVDPVSQAAPWTWAANDSVSIRASVPIQGWNSNFNPLLSMPLVEIGGTTEQALYYAAVSTNSTSNTYRPYYTNESYNTVSGLGVVDNSSSLGWNFKATQRVKATVNWSWSQTSTGSYSASLIKKNTLGTNVNDGSTDWNGYKIARMNTIAASNPSELTATVLMEPGDYLFPVTNVTNSDSASDRSVLSLVVEKDFSNTNMAHIIKPAVAMLKDIKAYNVEGGTSTAGTNTRVLNTINGESWFVTLSGTGTTGIGGSNTDFTLEPGTYKIVGNFEIYRSDRTFVYLYDVTNSTSLSQYVGSTSYQHSGTGIGTGQVHLNIPSLTVTSSTEFNIKHYVETGLSTEGFGVAHDQSGYNTCYATLQIEKLK
jgi:hypothetical protein